MYMLSTRGPPQNKKFTQAKSEGIGKNISCKCNQAAGVAILRSVKTDFETVYKKRQRRSLHSTKQINRTRGYNPDKYIIT